MQQFTTHRGIGVPLRQSDIDTDQIVPAEFLKRISKTGFDDALFAGWRKDPEFVLNREPYRRGSVLVAGPDFGIGSSREHAVWALRDYGFDVVISSRFGDIFRGNAGKQGLLTAQVDQRHVELLWGAIEQRPGAEIEVDLEARTVVCGDATVPFVIDDYTRWRLLQGLDDIALTLEHEDDIRAYEAARPAFKPATLPVRG